MFADQAQVMVERAASYHEVLGMHFKEPDVWAARKYIHKVLGL